MCCASDADADAAAETETEEEETRAADKEGGRWSVAVGFVLGSGGLGGVEGFHRVEEDC